MTIIVKTKNIMTLEQKELVEKNHNLIYSFLNQYHLSDEDYYSVAAIGLCIAAMKYNASKSQFSTYAYQCMKSHVFTEIRKKKTLNRIPEEILTSYNSEITDKDGKTTSILSLIPSKENIENEVLFHISLEEFEKKLNKKNKQIFQLFKEGYKQKEIAKITGCSQSQISRIKRELIKYLTD